uniref:Ovule protein n=1 Tax=Steinernema glaseri TaxID=37863 RepID=A0A1I7Y6A8_9BILA
METKHRGVRCLQLEHKVHSDHFCSYLTPRLIGKSVRERYLCASTVNNLIMVVFLLGYRAHTDHTVTSSTVSDEKQISG